VNAAHGPLIGNRDVVGRSVREALPEVADQGFFTILDQVFTTGQPFVGRGVAIRLERHLGAGLDEVFVDFVYQPIVDASVTVRLPRDLQRVSAVTAQDAATLDTAR
jgi:hypothetical protein